MAMCLRLLLRCDDLHIDLVANVLRSWQVTIQHITDDFLEIRIVAFLCRCPTNVTPMQ